MSPLKGETPSRHFPVSLEEDKQPCGELLTGGQMAKTQGRLGVEGDPQLTVNNNLSLTTERN